MPNLIRQEIVKNSKAVFAIKYRLIPKYHFRKLKKKHNFVSLFHFSVRIFVSMIVNILFCLYVCLFVSLLISKLNRCYGQFVHVLVLNKSFRKRGQSTWKKFWTTSGMYSLYKVQLDNFWDFFWQWFLQHKC